MEPVAKVENYDITVGTEAEADDLRWPKLSDLLLAWSAQSCHRNHNEWGSPFVNGVLSSELCQAAEELGTEDHVIQAGSKQVSYDPFRRMHFSDLDNNLGWERVKRTLFKNHVHRNTYYIYVIIWEYTWLTFIQEIVTTARFYFICTWSAYTHGRTIQM